MNCPVCSAAVAPIETQCPKCGANLTEYSQVYYMPDRLFNEALSKMRHGHYQEASGILGRAAMLRPGDREILLAWAQSCSLARDHAAAVRVLDIALDYFSEDDEVVELFVRENQLAEEA